MHPEATIRDARLDDVAGIQHVARDTYHAAYGHVLGADALDEQVDEWYDDEGVENRVMRDASTLLVAEHPEDGVVGYASSGPTPTSDDEPDPPPEQATLYTLYVHPDYWGERYGHHLLEATEDRLRERGFETMEIPVLADNDRARQFYDDHGYPTTDTGTVDFAGTTVDEAIHHGSL